MGEVTDLPRDEWERWADELEGWVETAVETLRIMRSKTFDGEPIAAPLERVMRARPDRS